MSIIRYLKVFNFEWILLKVLCLLVMALFTTLISGHNTLYNAQPLSISKINFCHCLLKSCDSIHYYGEFNVHHTIEHREKKAGRSSEGV